MKLETADRVYESIDDFTITEAVNAVGETKTDFAILTLDDGSFMQTAGGTLGMVLEYRDLTTGEHFTASGERLSAADVIAAFESFAAGDGIYKQAADWRPLEETTGSGSGSGCGSAVIALAVLAGLFYLFT
jgi:hypothetical protein